MTAPPGGRSEAGVPAGDEPVAAWMLADSPVGWQDRGRAARLLREEHERLEQARHEAEVARHELSRLRNRRPVRLALELAGAPRTGVRQLPRRLRAAARPVEVGEPPLPPAGPAPTPPAESPSQRRFPRRADHPHVRVAHLGPTRRFAAAAPHWALRDDGDWRARLESGTELLLLEQGPGGPLPALATEAAAYARRVGVPVALLGDAPDPELAARADLVLREAAAGDRAGSDLLPPTVDERVFNPRGWQPTPPDPVVAVVTTPEPDADVLARLLAFDPPVTLVRTADVPLDAFPDGARVSSRADDPKGLARSLRRAGVLVDHVGLHRDALDAERLRVAAATCGVPVVGLDGVDDGLARPHEDLRGAVDDAHRLLVDHDRRERHSIDRRRHALLERTHGAGFRRLLDALAIPAAAEPRVTSVISTNRPERVEHALRSAAAQRYPRHEVVLVLHGDGFDDPPARVEGLDRLDVVRMPAERVLGDCLNAGIDLAGGDHIAKIDDDDHYGPWHVTDLVLAQRYSGADVVGKRIDFAHLADRDVTVRRDVTTPERFRGRVSGPTMLLPAATARRFRFLRLPRRVDSTLCERVEAAGGRIYITHSRDVVLGRHGEDHTWRLDDRELVAGAVQSRPGLDLAWASSAPDAEA